MTGSAQRIDGYREHSNGDAIRGNVNLGYRVLADVETRFYVSAATTNQRIPGEVTKAQALDAPRDRQPDLGRAGPAAQRRFDPRLQQDELELRRHHVEFGAFYNYRHVDHPIFQYLDFTVDDYGGFVRAVDDRTIGGMRNRLIARRERPERHDRHRAVRQPARAR